jgi:uncharacterized membrane protein YdfJ with MMPL/SSD domain
VSRHLRRQEWWDQRREVVGTVLLYLCFLAYVPYVVAIALTGHSFWWMAAMLVPIYIAVTIKGDV